MRGRWSDTATFAFEIFEIGQESYQVHFKDDRVEFSSPELGIEFEGQQVNP